MPVLNEGVIVCEFASEAGEASSSDDVTNADEASRGNDALDADTSWLLCADVWVESEFDEWGCHAFLPATWPVHMVLQLLECLALLPNQEALTNGADIRLQEKCWNSYTQWLCHDLLL